MEDVLWRDLLKISPLLLEDTISLVIFVVTVFYFCISFFIDRYSKFDSHPVVSSVSP